MMTIDTAPLANSLGFLALGAYILTLMPTNLRIVFPQTKQTSISKWLIKHRRIIGIISFLLALGHGYLLVLKRDFDFFDPSTYWIYIQGVSTFTVFTLLAITSNDWSVKRLKKNWKQLHNLTYLAMFLLTWHVWDKMSEHWSYLTPIGLLAMGVITLMFVVRRWLEYRNKQQKAKVKVSQPQVPEKIKITA
jgi:sulfoxide reductase heme-binding subunit YedZ